MAISRLQVGDYCDFPGDVAEEAAALCGRSEQRVRLILVSSSRPVRPMQHAATDKSSIPVVRR